MCGIVGRVVPSWQGAGAPLTEIQNLKDQLARISYRGPDGSGVWSQGNAALGHVRLAIIDLGSGAQPMRTADEKLAITFNGEIYNYLELRQELEKQGERFATHSDTEVLLVAYRKWGEAMLPRLNGMFAFAIYDVERNRLFCARDPFGQKPFFYTLHRDEFYFASEIGAFRALPFFKNEVSAATIEHYLAFEGFYGDRTIYDEIKKLEPGNFAVFENGKLKISRYFKDVPEETLKDPREAVERTDAALLSAVKLACRADVPVSMLLSGGLDSSLVLAYFRQCFPGQKISGFHIQISDPTYDESRFAKMAAQETETDLEIFEFGLPAMAQIASSLPGKLDQPQADPGIVPKYFVCEQVAKKNFKVALTGDGGDEFFYGYLIMKAQKIARYYGWVPNLIHNSVVRPLVNALPSRTGYMQRDFLAKRFVRGFPAQDHDRSYKWMGSFSENEIKAILPPSGMGIQAGLQYLKSVGQDSKNSSSMGKFAYTLQRAYLPDYILCNSDRAAMLHSLELRSPLLDPQLCHLLNQTRDSIKMPGFETKGLMKKVAQRYFSRDLVYRKKVGFTIPMAQLLKENLRVDVEDTLSSRTIAAQGLFHDEGIQGLLNRHFSGKDNLYKPIWTLYSLQKWLQTNQVQIRGQ